MRLEARIIAYLAIIAGSISFYIGWSGENEDTVMQSAGAVVVAGLALLGATAGLSTWHDERERARELQQRDVYATLVLQLLSRFSGAGTWNPQTEVQVRTQVAIWADPAVVKKLSAWNKVYDRHVASAPTGLFKLTPEAKAAFEAATAEVAQAVRQELSPNDSVNVAELTQALFNQPSK